jgi:ergothioneine biosynthesis protein EgtB
MQPILSHKLEGSDLSEKYFEVRAYTEQLCAPLETEDFVPQPVVDVSPAKWNIAHTSWFFEEMILTKFLKGYSEFHPSYRYLFNSYYNSVGERTERHNRGDLSRPTVKEVFAYRSHVDESMRKLFARGIGKKAEFLVTLGINHEQQHQELLLTDLKYTFSRNPLDPVYQEGPSLVEEKAVQKSGFAKFDGGSFEIGYSGEGFCFDNELAPHTVRLEDFSISLGLVTNGEFIEFIESGGYQDFRLWHSEGWDWVRENGVTKPLYWNLSDGEWDQFTLAGRRPIRASDPVAHVSFYEAAAFAAWKGLRLPTEFEWEAASSEFKWGIRWEWTNSAYLPYPGFTIAPGAVGEYNGKFMINQMVLRGGSVATPPGHSRRTYRNFFHPHLRWQFTGIRLAK